jgi:hypothetical protein
MTRNKKSLQTEYCHCTSPSLSPNIQCFRYRVCATCANPLTQIYCYYCYYFILYLKIIYYITTNIFPLVHNVQTDSGAHSASYRIDTRDDSPRGVKGCSVKINTHFHLVSRSRMVEIYLHSPICHDTVLN